MYSQTLSALIYTYKHIPPNLSMNIAHSWNLRIGIGTQWSDTLKILSATKKSVFNDTTQFYEQTKNILPPFTLMGASHK